MADSEQPSAMTSNRPYLLRAIYEWIVDNEMTPHLVVDSHEDQVQVPDGFADEMGQVILNISPMACRDLQLANDAVSFSARFRGVAHYVFVPMLGVRAVYARENGRGLVFARDDEDLPPPPPPEDTPPPSGNKRPALKVIK